MKQSRRQFLGKMGYSAVAIPLSGLLYSGTASSAEKLDPEDNLAKALGYVHESPSSAKRCSNCQLFKGGSTAKWGKCSIFGSKLVNAKGWCSSWSA